MAEGHGLTGHSFLDCPCPECGLKNLLLGEEYNFNLRRSWFEDHIEIMCGNPDCDFYQYYRANGYSAFKATFGLWWLP